MAHFGSKNIKVSEPSQHVLHIQLARGPVNAFTNDLLIFGLWAEYGTLLDRIVSEGEDVRAVVVSSALEKIFTSGLDLSQGILVECSTTDPARRAFRLRNFIDAFQRAIRAPERCPFPVIVAVHGPVFGLGIDLISACDIRYAASNAVFSIKEVDAGLAADIGTLAYLHKITSNASLARELAYTARSFSASEALALGLVSKVVEGGRDRVVSEAIELAKVIASKSPVAVYGTKVLLSHGRDHSVAQSLDYTAVWNGAAIQSSDVTDSLEAFRRKKVAVYKPVKAPGPKL